MFLKLFIYKFRAVLYFKEKAKYKRHYTSSTTGNKHHKANDYDKTRKGGNLGPSTGDQE